MSTQNDLHVRECHACGVLNDFNSRVIPGVLCPECGSQDTRPVRPVESKKPQPFESFIVAEVSKIWLRKQGVSRVLDLPGDEFEPATDGPILTQLFERVINANWMRGYARQSFQLNRVMIDPDQLNETIIAVFRPR